MDRDHFFDRCKARALLFSMAIVVNKANLCDCPTPDISSSGLAGSHSGRAAFPPLCGLVVLASCQLICVDRPENETRAERLVSMSGKDPHTYLQIYRGHAAVDTFT